MLHMLLILNPSQTGQFEGKTLPPFLPSPAPSIFNLYRNSRITICRFCIICIMRSMEADCLEYQRVTHIRVSMGNRLCTLGSLGDQGNPLNHKSHMLKRLQLIPWIQWVAWRTVPVTGAGAGHGTVVYHSRCNTVAYHTDSATCGR